MVPARARLLALSPERSADVLREVAKASGMELVRVKTVGGLFRRLEGERWTVTLISLGCANVDESVAQKVSSLDGSGSLLLSAQGVTLDRALLMERVGAVGIISEPLDPVDLEARLEALILEGPFVSFPSLPPTTDDVQLVGRSPALAESLETLARVARSSATVLVTGESGTGKELVARSLHHASDRADGPFVAINCAAIPEQLLESELFGHERGAFTGAVARRIGRFERANQGTLFLDEIGDMSGVLQAKLLRVLEDCALMPVGGSEPVKIDVRIVAATNQDLDQRRAKGAFREDLYHRLAVVEIRLPPLRERRTDIRELALHFASRFAEKHDRPVRAISERALERLEAYPWPGNVRELRNVMDRAVLLASGETLRPGDLRLGASSPHASPRVPVEAMTGYPASLSLSEVEARHIRTVLSHVSGHIGKAAERLGIHRNTLTRKIQEHGIDAPGREEAVIAPQSTASAGAGPAPPDAADR